MIGFSQVKLLRLLSLSRESPNPAQEYSKRLGQGLKPDLLLVGVPRCPLPHLVCVSHNSYTGALKASVKCHHREREKYRSGLF